MLFYKKICMLVAIFLMVNHLTACDDGNTYHYKNYKDIPEYGGVSTWLPSIFPNTAEDIVIYTHIDTNFFYIYYSLPAKQAEHFEESLKIKVSEEGLIYLSRNKAINNGAWCKLSSLKQGGEKRLYLISKIAENNIHRYYLTHPLVNKNIPLEEAEHSNMSKYCEVESS